MRIWHLVIAGLILGVSAVFGVPIVSMLIGKVAPATVAQYLPSSTIPAVDQKAIVSTFIYGLFLAGVLFLLSMVGIRARVGRD